LSSQYRNFRRGGSCTAFLEKIKTEETEMKLKKSGDNGGYWLSRSAANPVSSSLGWGFVRDAGALRYQCVRCRKKINLRSGCICRKNPAAVKKTGRAKRGESDGTAVRGFHQDHLLKMYYFIGILFVSAGILCYYLDRERRNEVK
jgi:hypothetical protein